MGTCALRVNIDGKLVDSRVLELSRRNVVVEHEVNLAKVPILGLRQAEPAPQIAEQICAGVKEACLGAPVPCYEVHVSSTKKTMLFIMCPTSLTYQSPKAYAG